MTEPCSCGPGCDCGCCEGTEPLTPQPIANRPGLDALSYRIGTHATFLETMQARLSSNAFPALAGLTTRAESDPSLALLDAWAVVADVLTFYQERIANEGYLAHRHGAAVGAGAGAAGGLHASPGSGGEHLPGLHAGGDSRARPFHPVRPTSRPLPWTSPRR